jgi:hypothetical protein
MSTAAEEVQALLRFLTQDSKLPLPLALSTAKSLRDAKLTKYAHGTSYSILATYILLFRIPADERSSAEEISKCKLETLEAALPGNKNAKKIWNAAKRSGKKRPASDNAQDSPQKRSKKSALGPEATPSEVEEALTLPICTDLDEISKTVVITNRAPLVLAFAVMVLKYTMPEQPLSSRLSLARSVVSHNSESRARNLGLVSGASAEEEGWGTGQPTVRVLGRDIRVMKRHGYSRQDVGTIASHDNVEGGTANEVGHGDASVQAEFETSPALWGLDLGALRESDGLRSRAAGPRPVSALPIYAPELGRQYLLHAFGQQKPEDQGPAEEQSKTKGKGKSRPVLTKERCAGMVLGAIDAVCGSWASSLDRDELDRRAWSWYVKVRPDVRDGIPGWGQKGPVVLADILQLRKQP